MSDSRSTDRQPPATPATTPAKPTAELCEDELKKVQGGVSDIVITKNTDIASPKL